PLHRRNHGRRNQVVTDAPSPPRDPHPLAPSPAAASEGERLPSPIAMGEGVGGEGTRGQRFVSVSTSAKSASHCGTTASTLNRAATRSRRLAPSRRRIAGSAN